MSWLLALCGVIVFAVALPAWMRASLCVTALVANLRCLAPFILLRGPRAVRVIEWTDEGGFRVFLGMDEIAQPAQLAAGSFRLGRWLVVLRLRTPNGLCPVLIDGRVQSPGAFRALCVHLALSAQRFPASADLKLIPSAPKV